MDFLRFLFVVRLYLHGVEAESGFGIALFRGGCGRMRSAVMLGFPWRSTWRGSST